MCIHNLPSPLSPAPPSLPLPQVDGEPWVQAPAAVRVSRRGQGLVLRRVQSKPLARMMQVGLGGGEGVGGWVAGQCAPHACMHAPRLVCPLHTSCCPTACCCPLLATLLLLDPGRNPHHNNSLLQALSEVLEESEQRGTITAAQHHTLMAELAAKLQPLLLHPG